MYSVRLSKFLLVKIENILKSMGILSLKLILLKQYKAIFFKNYNKQFLMDIEKDLTVTIDPDFLLKDNFTYNGHNAELYVYQDYVFFSTQKQSNSLLYHQQFNFEIIYAQQKCTGIKFYNPQQYVFIKQQWEHFDIWQTFLIKKIKQRNFHQYFKPLRKLGKGNFASVYLAHNKKKDTLVAVKAFVKQLAFKTNGRKALQNQIAILRKISSPYLMKLLGVYETGNSLYIVTEYIEGTTLENYLKINQSRINYEQRKSIMKMLLKGLCELEKKGILHRDLKPDNIMITNDGKNLKIVDFGLATQTNIDKYIFVRCGTPGYVAPQILRIRDDQKPVLDSISDMFSLGSIFYQMLFQRRLFNAVQHEDVLNQNRACLIKITSEMKNSISFDEADLLQKMLAINPKNRISASAAMQHSYICQRVMNIFGSVRNRLTKPFNMKISRKNITSLDKNENIQNFKSLHK